MIRQLSSWFSSRLSLLSSSSYAASSDFSPVAAIATWLSKSVSVFCLVYISMTSLAVSAEFSSKADRLTANWELSSSNWLM